MEWRMALVLVVACQHGSAAHVTTDELPTATPSATATASAQASAAASVPVPPASAQGPSSGDPVVLVWNGGGGWVTLTIYASGKATYDFTPSGWGAQGRVPKHEKGRFSPAELSTLSRTLASHHVCSLRSSGRPAVPEERSGNLWLDLPGLHCEVRMLEDEWSEPGDKGACGKALQDAVQHVAPKG